jgi:hypothetical protein
MPRMMAVPTRKCYVEQCPDGESEGMTVTTRENLTRNHVVLSLTRESLYRRLVQVCVATVL